MIGVLDDSQLAGKKVHFVGIKGTGMSALAELYLGKHALVSGSDVAEHFYTDVVLEGLGIKPQLFDEKNITPNIDLVIHSAAYKKTEHPELLKAAELSIPIMEYPVALGEYSRLQASFAISGVHGKTTTTALFGTIAKHTALPATILVGSSVSNFSNKSTCTVGSKYFVAETCEYRRHFMNFSASAIVVTSIESDHQDYYPDYASIFQAFVEFVSNMPVGGHLVFCADDAGASELACRIKELRPDLRQIAYGFSASGYFRILTEETRHGTSSKPGYFHLAGIHNRHFCLQIPGKHIIQDAAAAIALYHVILEQQESRAPTEQELDALVAAVSVFAGSRRRAEIIGTWKDILIMDDYAHHPTAIRLTLQGLKEFYPDRRLIVDFMSHTYSRTETLFKEFSECFEAADKLIVHDIYPSAREKSPDHYTVTGTSLFESIRSAGTAAVYFAKPLDALDYVLDLLQPGDLFITLGAGDNWTLAHEVYRNLISGAAR